MQLDMPTNLEREPERQAEPQPEPERQAERQSEREPERHPEQPSEHNSEVMPTMPNVQPQTDINFEALKKTLIQMTLNATPRRYREGHKRTGMGFYTLFHGSRATTLKNAIDQASNPAECLAIIQHQLHFFDPTENSLPLPDVVDESTRTRLEKASHWTVNSPIGLYGLLLKLRSVIEDDPQYSATLNRPFN